MDIRSGNELIAAVAARARDLGIAIGVETLEPEPGEGHADALLRIECGGDARMYAAAIKRGLRPATLGATLHRIDRLAQPAVLITDYVTPQMAEALKGRGTAFLDAAGNAYINQPPVLVWVKGERPAHLEIQPADTGRAFRPGGLKVLFALLCHPEWVDHPYRDIARRAAVAHGTVGGVMTDLHRLRFIAQLNGSRRLLQPERLLRQWAEAFARTLRPKLLLGHYHADPGSWWEDLIPDEYGVLLGGEPAAAKVTGHLRPQTITLYSDKPSPRLILDYKLRPAADGRVEFVKRFWAFDADDEAVVPLPLIYADLLMIGDARCLETADLIYERIVDGFVR
jgi:hypothetical protein